MENKEKKINIKISSPLRLIIYILIIMLLLGGSIVGLTKVFKTQEKVLKLGFEDVGELITQTCHTTVLEDSVVNRSFFKLFDIPFTESRQIFSYDFDVDASINFSEIDILDIDDDKETITVKLPSAKIYKVVLIPKSFRSYLDSESLFSRIDLTEHNEALIKMEETAKTQCLESNLLTRADENAKKLLSAMIRSEQKYKKYNIVFNYDNDNNKDEQGVDSK